MRVDDVAGIICLSLARADHAERGWRRLAAGAVAGRGLHSSIFHVNLSCFSH
jgi:hypothetical protein